MAPAELCVCVRCVWARDCVGTWACALSVIGVQMYLQTRDRGKSIARTESGNTFGTRLAVMFSVTVLLVFFMWVCRQAGPKSGLLFHFGVFMGTDVAVRVHVMALAAVRRL